MASQTNGCVPYRWHRPEQAPAPPSAQKPRRSLDTYGPAEPRSPEVNSGVRLQLCPKGNQDGPERGPTAAAGSRARAQGRGAPGRDAAAAAYLSGAGTGSQALRRLPPRRSPGRRVPANAGGARAR